MNDIVLKIKNLRKDKKLTQNELAQRIGVTDAMISAYENGIRIPSVNNIVALAKVFNDSSDYLLGLESDNELQINIESLNQDQRNLVLNLVEQLSKITGEKSVSIPQLKKLKDKLAK